MTEFIKSLTISGFRNLSELEVPSFAKVNLITGKNNAGKSSLLEAIRILATGGAVTTFFDILSYRDELKLSVDSERPKAPTDLYPICNLFTGFPRFVDSHQGFFISATGDFPSKINEVSGKIGWYVSRFMDNGQLSYEAAESDLFGEVDGFPSLEIIVAGRKRVIPLERLQRRALRIDTEPVGFPCIYLDPFSSRSTSQMGALWDQIALTDVEPEIVKALQIVSPDIQGVSVIGGDDRSRGRTAIAKSTAFENPVPLRTFGDGANRLFGIVLSLCNARNGILLVDEIENGLHYSAQKEIWRTIFKLAQKLNVQIFATSHSWDCVQAFQVAATESPDEGMLLRLSRRGERIIPTTFNESELEIATSEQIEVR
ncbi:AAA family ATPase [Delftia acidovorans]|uniref:AAA family ATPase n=1 Tax=Delftia acidovorans TaxID=80866 RepID=UPI0035A03764